MLVVRTVVDGRQARVRRWSMVRIHLLWRWPGGAPAWLAVAAVVAACGSSTQARVSEGAGGYTLTNCPSGSGLPAACAPCLQGSCSDTLSAINSACSDFLSCACPIGSDASACSPSTTCVSMGTSAASQCAACQSECSGSSGEAASYTLSNCPGGGAVPAACTSCLETSCSTQLAEINSACSAYLDCFCPAGDTSCTATTSCTAAIELSTGECMACDAACGAATGEAGIDDASACLSDGGLITSLEASEAGAATPSSLPCWQSMCATQFAACERDACCNAIFYAAFTCLGSAPVTNTAELMCFDAALTSSEADVGDMLTCLEGVQGTCAVAADAASD